MEFPRHRGAESHEFTPEQTPALWTAARVSLQKKLAEHCEGSSFGRIQSGLAAAYLRLGEGAYGQIRKMVWKASGTPAS